MNTAEPVLSLAAVLLAFAVQALAFGGLGVLARTLLQRRLGRELTGLETLALGALAPALAGFAAFWIYFAHPLAGRCFSGTVLLGAGLAGGRAVFRPSTVPAAARRAGQLMFLAGAFYLAALALFPGPTFARTGMLRFIGHMPGDNEIPQLFAERLYRGQSPKQLMGDWLSSDRPPLQTGLALLTLPASRALGIDLEVACGATGVWFQLLWIPALMCFLRWLGRTEREAHAIAAALVFTGFLLFNSVYTWPKLGAAALTLLAFCTFFEAPIAHEPPNRWRFALGGALAACGALAHSGAMFALLALTPLAAFASRHRRRAWLTAAAAFGVLALPWVAYQRLYEPPGDRLLKWHLAGAIAPDTRSFSTVLRDNYRELGWSKAWEARRANAQMVFAGSWKDFFAVETPKSRYDRRVEEWAYPLRALALWPLGLLALAVVMGRRIRRQAQGDVRPQALAGAWLGLTLLVWIAVLFQANAAFTHQGSFTVQLVALGLLGTWLMQCGRGVFIGVAALQAGWFAFIWLPPSTNLSWGPNSAAGLTCAIAALGLALSGARALRRPEETAVAPAAKPFSVLEWWRAPALNGWVLAALALLLFARKPHALHTPQLYAEDGSIFLAFNDLHGLRAFAEPYMGYLHLLPRLIAWTASRLLDPMWWPTFYNGVSFLIWLAVIARTFSPRLDLPGKPGLALAFIIGPHTGEVLFNITNLQWITAMLLVQQALIAPPVSGRERAIDCLIVAALGLTGPFVLALLPLLAWRWWRNRQGENLAVLLIASAAAAVQAWFIFRTAPHVAYPPFDVARFFGIVGQRLWLWPVLGSSLALKLPPLALGVLGIAPVVALLVWTLRPHARRSLRAPIVGAFLLLLAAAIYRSRPDTWPFDNLAVHDRYFYLPRVLLLWLVVWEFDAAPRAVAWAARAVFAAVALVHVKDYAAPAPPNYRWAEHCEPIRQGVPANIPTLPEGWTLEYRGRPDVRSFRGE